jgi:hypothetical protein
MKHHPIPASRFTKLVLRSLSKRGLFITSSFCAPDDKGSFANGETAYVLSNGKAMPFLAVLDLASGKVGA